MRSGPAVASAAVVLGMRSQICHLMADVWPSRMRLAITAVATAPAVMRRPRARIVRRSASLSWVERRSRWPARRSTIAIVFAGAASARQGQQAAADRQHGRRNDWEARLAGEDAAGPKG
jgi:hypothetical protein